MASVEIVCFYCKKRFLRPTGRVNEAIKFGWKQYCSPSCQKKAKSKNTSFKCGNPKCSKIIERHPSNTPSSGICFCSRSCAAIVNNPRSRKRRPFVKTCPHCGNQFTGRRKYCSIKCIPKKSPVYKDIIISEIKHFYQQNDRIPLKMEFLHCKAARSRFGTWNKAIKAAGFKPNPVKFAKKYTAKDGHLCDSLSEKIIDDWLLLRKIPHERNVRYPNPKFTADFKVKDFWIEFFGLHHELKSYDRLMKQKLKEIKENDLKLISIFPKDIFPKFKLDQVLLPLLK